MISIKKVGIVVATAGLLAATAVPAFAGHQSNDENNGGRGTTVTQTNSGRVNNSVNVSSNTGKNQGGSNGSSREEHGSSRGGATTGNAATEALVGTAANSNVAVLSCGCTGGTTVTQLNRGNVRNNVNVSSNTGKNTGNVSTGDAYTGAAVLTVANTNVVTQ